MSTRKRVGVKPMGKTSMSGDINVTPLVDVVLVLLIIFMVVTPLLEKDIPLSMPKSEKVEEVTDVPPDQLVVNIAANNDLKVNFAPVTLEELQDRLKERLDHKRDNDKVVFIVSDDQANYGRLVAVLDKARGAGAKVLGMATDLPENAASQSDGQPAQPAPVEVPQ